MTNEEKYKTPEERAKAYFAFCSRHQNAGICLGCPALQEVGICVLNWLALDADEEPIPCPFCGGKATLYEVAGVKPHVQCNACRVSMYGDTRIEAIAAWNRRAK